MSYELINRITIKRDSVYVSSHSNNDTSSYISHRIPFLTEAYNSGGRRLLDRVILGMLYSTFTPCYSCQKTEGIYQNTDLVYFEYLDAVKPVRLTVSEARIIRNENQIGGIKYV